MMLRSFWELFPFFIYLSLLAFLGIRSYRKGADQEEYLLSNRSLTVPALVATLVTTWYGGILGVGEFIYRFGISAWFVFGLPYYLFAVLFAYSLAPRIRNMNVFSIPDILNREYGRYPGLLGSVFVLIMTSPAPYILMVGVLLQLLLDISFLHGILLGTVISVAYVYWGGFRSVVQTDKLQFLFMFTGFVVLALFLLNGDVSPGKLWNRISDLHKDPTGGMSLQTIVVWFLIASWTFIDPGFHQRCAAAKTAADARKGVLYAVGFWFIFDMLSLATGLYAVALLQNINPLLTFPLVADYALPPVLRGLFIVSLMAIVMSTVDSYAFLSAITFGRDIMGSAGKDDSLVNRHTKAGLLMTALIAVGMILLMPSVIELWYNLGSLFIPPLLLPVFFAYFPKFKTGSKETFILMLVSFLTTLIIFIPGQFRESGGEPVYLFGIQPFFTGLVVSVSGYLYFRKWPLSAKRDRLQDS